MPPDTIASPVRTDGDSRKWLVVALLWLGACLNYVDRLAIFTIVPLLQKELVMTDVAAALIGSVFLWAYAVCSPVGGYLGDRFNRKTILVSSVAAFSLVTFATGLARTGGQIIGLRVFLGFSEALFLPSALAHIASFHSEKTRSTANAIALTGLTAGAGLGSYYGGYMADYHSWRTGFYLLGIAGAIFCGILLALLPARSRMIVPQELRGVGSKPHGSIVGNALAILRTPTAACVIFFGFSFSLSSWALGAWGPSYLHEHFGLTLAHSGASMGLFTSLPALFGGLAGGWAADRWARQNPKARLAMQLIGACTIAPTMALFGFLPTVAIWDADLALYALGRGAVEVNSMPVFSGVIPSSRWSTAYGMYNFAGTLAGSLGVLFVGRMKANLGIGYSMSILAIPLFFGAAAILITLFRFISRDMQVNEERLAAATLEMRSIKPVP